MARIRVGDPGINAGRLDKRVSLLKPTYNDFEDEIVDWAKVTDVWAELNPVTGREGEQSGRTVAIGEITLAIRFRSDIDKRWRVQYGSRLFDIAGIVNVIERNEQLIVICQEVE